MRVTLPSDTGCWYSACRPWIDHQWLAGKYCSILGWVIFCTKYLSFILLTFSVEMNHLRQITLFLNTSLGHPIDLLCHRVLNYNLHMVKQVFIYRSSNCLFVMKNWELKRVVFLRFMRTRSLISEKKAFVIVCHCKSELMCVLYILQKRGISLAVWKQQLGFLASRDQGCRVTESCHRCKQHNTVVLG